MNLQSTKQKQIGAVDLLVIFFFLHNPLDWVMAGIELNIVNIFQDKINKEEKYSRYNLNRLCYQWRAIMRDAKTKELIKDIEVLSQTFERVIDSKDAIIKSLAKDLAEADEQYAVVLRDQIQKVDFLIGMMYYDILIEFPYTA